MNTDKPKIYMSDIHLEDYTEQYEGKHANVGTMVFDGGRKKELLNGEWQYAVDQYDTCLRQQWFKERYYDESGNTFPLDYSFDEWPTMQLPSCWNTVAKEYLIYDGSMVFTRKFSFDIKAEEEVVLKIGAANYLCRVFLNGEYVGMHRGGSTPAYFNITEALKKENRMILVVDSTRRAEQVPTENTDWFNYGGIYRDIELIRLPNTHIKTFRVALVPDGTYGNISVKVELSKQITTTAEFTIKELGIKEQIAIENGIGMVVIEAEPKLWSPDEPKLYTVTATCLEDTVSDNIGFREIKVMGRDIVLNGKPLFLRGISCHEESIENGKALTDEERIENIKIAKELGCNFMRIAHYPHHEKMAKLADEMGMLLWEEIPVYWAIRFERDKTYEDASNQLLELINRDWNRASVIIWSVGNENADTDERLSFMSRLAQCAHKEDETRLVSAACLVDSEKNVIADRLIEYLDVIGINEYCGWYTPDFEKLPELMANSNPKKPVIITEFGADALPEHHGTITDKGTEECQAYVYEQQLETLEKISYIKGMTPWILYDFRCPRRTSFIQKYYNRKGLCSADKKYRKMAFAVLQKFYLELKKLEQ
ncbi:glycoside hydrolase family 2 protein [Anaerosporobacter sp.]|uniref:glycoside hydrolase family 2 protein n=1 Tax=Anaerosporobacter sp. TaxID=1872529 RepID=UPI00286F2544|nr:glycoside hydrolase family 2 TIM barrel-domain containing protein [Anaerosporobacter sp.]